MKKRASPRATAVMLLLECFRKHLPLDQLFLDPAVDRLEDRDRRFVKELVYGTLRHRLQLDYFLDRLSNRSLNRIDEEVLWILRSALYQIRYLRVPDHAAVNEAANLCRRFDRGSASAFVNALLRNFVRQRPEPPEGNSAADLSIRYSHPEWLVKRYLVRYGAAEAMTLMERNNRPPDAVLWVNPMKIAVEPFCRRLHQEGITAHQIEGLKHAVVVESENIVQHRFYRQGYCFLMDANSQRVAELPDLRNRNWIGDLCAAPGNKSFILATRKSKRARLISADANLRRMAGMKVRLELYGISSTALLVQSLETAPALPQILDFILLDVPCSGLGTIRSNPDIRWKVREEDLPRFQTRQLRYLSNGFKSLRPGGELLYSTCSTEPEENVRVVDQFLSECDEAERSAPDRVWFSSALPGDGFYAARVRRL